MTWRERFGEWVGYHPLLFTVALIVAVFGTAAAVAYGLGR